MRHYLIAAAAITLAAHAQPQPTAVLSQDQIQQLELTIARNPGVLASEALLGKNYAFFILGIKSLGQFDKVESIDLEKATGDFAQHARGEFGKSLFAGVVAEAGQALWRFSTEVEVSSKHCGVHRRKSTLRRPRPSAFRVSNELLPWTRQIVLWRKYRIPIVIHRSNFRNFLPLATTEAYDQVKQDISV